MCFQQNPHGKDGAPSQDGMRQQLQPEEGVQSLLNAAKGTRPSTKAQDLVKTIFVLSYKDFDRALVPSGPILRDEDFNPALVTRSSRRAMENGCLRLCTACVGSAPQP